jgi:hypothetical protein
VIPHENGEMIRLVEDRPNIVPETAMDRRLQLHADP